jgi:hypothetical protein
MRLGVPEQMCVSFSEQYRICHRFGFGGKFWNEANGLRLRVSCYREDETPKIHAVIEDVNSRLSIVVQRAMTAEAERRLEGGLEI